MASDVGADGAPPEAHDAGAEAHDDAEAEAHDDAEGQAHDDASPLTEDPSSPSAPAPAPSSASSKLGDLAAKLPWGKKKEPKVELPPPPPFTRATAATNDAHLGSTNIMLGDATDVAVGMLVSGVGIAKASDHGPMSTRSMYRYQMYHIYILSILWALLSLSHCY